MIAILDYGVGNLFSLKSSLAMLGEDACLTSDAAALRRADRLILPGVGAFRDAAAQLRATGLDQLVLEQAKKGVPILGICLGMQLLFEKSLEYGEYAGLGPDPRRRPPHCGPRAAESEDPSHRLERPASIPADPSAAGEHARRRLRLFRPQLLRRYARALYPRHRRIRRAADRRRRQWQCPGLPIPPRKKRPRRPWHSAGLLQPARKQRRHPMLILPAIDLYEKKAVRLHKGDYAQMTVYNDHPLAVAEDFAAAGAQWIHVVDLEGARDGTTPNAAVVDPDCRQDRPARRAGRRHPQLGHGPPVPGRGRQPHHPRHRSADAAGISCPGASVLRRAGRRRCGLPGRPRRHPGLDADQRRHL